MQGSKLTRKERAEMTRQRLTDAARELLELYGYDGVTVDDICNEAGVSKGAFYGHFESKDQVIISEFMRVDEYYREVYPQVLEERTYVDMLFAMNRLALRYIADQGKTIIKVVYSSEIAPGRKPSPVASQDRALYQLVESLVAAAKENGELRSDIDSSEMAHMIILMIRGLVYDWCLQDGGFDLVETGERLARFLLEGAKPR
jgi:TetR/AcrR family fatty acid metabolism transcriptional regulator